ncbi:MAG: hypothetical protein AB1349_14400 [Elusimicrobiota bacterium]
MKFEHIQNRNGNSCFLACIESFLKHCGVLRSQEELIETHKDLCKSIPGKEGVIPCGEEIVLCNKENILYNEEATLKNISELCQMQNKLKSLQSKESYIFGITQTPDKMHSVLFDSIDFQNNIWVMDPDQGHKTLNYNDIVEIKFLKLSYPYWNPWYIEFFPGNRENVS